MGKEPMLRGRAIAVAILAYAAAGAIVRGQDPIPGTLQELSARLDAQAAEIAALRQQLESQSALYGPVLLEQPCACEPHMRRLPVVAEDCWTPPCGESADDAPQFHTLQFYADYDNGFAIKPYCPEKHPFELHITAWTQFRHHAFARDVDSWTDNAGITRPVLNRNVFDIERARLVFSGYALDERLTYLIHFDGDTDGGHTVDLFDHWWAWEFSDRFQLLMGKRKVPASRQWILGARFTRFVDRPLACDFLRPDRTVGVFGVGRLGESGHYEVMVGNGYNDTNIPNSGVDDHLTFAATNYWDFGGEFGNQIVDFAWTPDPLLKVGHSFVYSPHTSDARGAPLDDTDFLRLTDGTRLTQPGAFAPGVTVSDMDLYFYGVDASWKWRGWSVTTELFFRWIEQLRGNGALPVNNLLQRGFYVEGGRFLIPQKLDVNFRYSQVSGLFGDSAEYAVGLNWYPLDSQRMKLSFDITELDGSPLNNSAIDILVGDDGTLFRTQFQAEF